MPAKTDQSSKVNLQSRKHAHTLSFTHQSQTQLHKLPLAVIVMHEAHLLSVEAQASLRRTLEKYTATARLILIVERLSNVSRHHLYVLLSHIHRSLFLQIMTPLRSRCYCLRIPAPSLEECETVLRNTCTKANVPMAPPNVIRDIATQSKCNLRRAIIMLQRALVMFDKPPPAVALLPTWVQVVKKVSHEICTQPTKEKSAAHSSQQPTVLGLPLSQSSPGFRFTSARNELLDILTSGIEGQTILEVSVVLICAATFFNVCTSPSQTMLVEILSSQKLDEQTALLITQGAAHLVSSHLISDTTRTLGECVPEFKRFCECSRRISSWETAM